VTKDLSAPEARRLALSAQGFADPLPKGAPTKRHLHRVMSRTGVLQLDSVNIVSRPQYVVPYSRLGPYDPRLLEAIAYHDKSWFEYWGHEASLIPVEWYQLFRPRMEWSRNGIHAQHDTPMWSSRLARYLRENRPFLDAVLLEIDERGPLSAGDLTDGGKSQSGVMWGWSRGKLAIETLFRTGEVAALRKLPSFQRVYDLPERVIPKDTLALPVLEFEAAERDLVVHAVRSLGVGTARDIGDYYRTKPADAKRRAEELVEEGALHRVGVEGWKDAGYIVPGTRIPKSVDRAALLTPFDPMVWNRPRALRLFGFDYRIEIYVPAGKRKHGYYVLPFLNGERIAARVDLKADRKAGALQVLGAWAEDGITTDDVAALESELSRFACFLGLERVQLSRRNLLRSLRV
jgi:uncharacterized protein YcaQ